MSMVELDERGIFRAAKRSEGGGFLCRFLPHPDSDVSSVASAVAVANQATTQDASLQGDLMSVHAPWASPSGIVGYVDVCDSAAALKVWSESVVRELTRLGWSGRISPVTNDLFDAEHPHKHVSSMAAGLVAPIDLEHWTSARRDGAPATMWLVPEPLTNTLVDFALDFMGESEGTYFVRCGQAQFKVDRAAVPGALRAMAGGSSQVALTSLETNGDLKRVLFGHAGHVQYELRRSNAGWPGELEELTRVLQLHAPFAEYGLIRSARSAIADWDLLMSSRGPRPPHVRTSYTRSRREQESTHVPDAYGAQLLSRRHLESATDLSRWNVQQAGGEMHLISSPNPVLWYGEEEVASEEVERARSDFGAMIMGAPS